MPMLNDYVPIVGETEIEELKLIAEKLQGQKILNINSTAVGGGVAEILNRMIPLFKDMGVDASWEVIKGGEKFYVVTKKFHNALHGKKESFTDEDFQEYLETVASNVPNLSL